MEELDEETIKENEKKGKEVIEKLLKEIENEKEENEAENIRLKGNKYFEVKNFDKAIEVI